MGFGGLGMWELVLIFLVFLLVFGAKRLPEIGQSLGKGIREFKSSVREIEGELKMPSDDARRHSVPPASRKPQEESEPRKLSEPVQGDAVEGERRLEQETPVESAGGAERKGTTDV